MVIDAFRIIARGRQYLSGMSSPMAMPLSLRDINPYLDHFEPPVPKTDFVRMVFAMDNVALEKDRAGTGK